MRAQSLDVQSFGSIAEEEEEDVDGEEEEEEDVETEEAEYEDVADEDDEAK